MPTPASIGLIFVALAVLFVSATVQHYLRAEGKLTPARQAWLRMAFIFAGIGIGLCMLQTLWDR